MGDDFSGESTYKYVDELVRRLERRLDRYETTQQYLLTGFPKEYASKADLDKVRDDAVELQTTIVGRDRFEALEKQVGENTGRRSALLGGLGFLVALIVALLGWGNGQLNSTQSQVNDQQQTIATLDKSDTKLTLQLIALRDKITELCRAEAVEKDHVSC